MFYLPKPLPIRCWNDPTLGFGKMSCRIVEELMKKGIKLDMHRRGDLELLIANLHEINKAESTSICYTMWESSILPAHAIGYLNRAKLIVVPCEYNREIFLQNGVKRPIAVVPLGVDTETYAVKPNKSSDVFTFGIAGTYYARKNIPFVINAFKKTFNGKKAILKLKTSKSPDPTPDETVTRHPQIQTITATLSEAEMARWYNSLDVFISCSHGEGFGLHQMEAMSCGVPIISPKFGGIREYLDETVGYCVDYRMSHPREDADYFYQGEWCHTHEKSLIQRMIQAFTNRAETAAKGIAARERACRFSWEHCSMKLAKVINNYVLLSKSPI